jgi:cytochrome c551/c552
MMANSARDPYWMAAVRREVMDHPSSQAEIEDECSICHMPMARATSVAAGARGELFRLLPTTGGATDAHRLAADGVSCSLCHQIGAEKLGTPESFVGGFVIAGGPPRMRGPFDVDTGRTRIMQSATGAEPAQSQHLAQSELCATCHTLFTQALAPDGTHLGSLPEQVPYLEWSHSAFREERSCQACHMPTVASTPITSVLGEPRETLSRHTFLGGNFFMLRMLNRFRSQLGIEAPPQELEASARATIAQLQGDTATVTIGHAAHAGNALEFDVAVRNLTGHKLPTGYPSRRVWLHVAVHDAAGRSIFESGAVDASGMIAGNDNDTDPQRFEPHFDEITRPDQVQVYEATMADPQGRLTTGLLQALTFVKDNRLLPRGFDKRTAGPDIAVRGAALDDGTFTEAGDRVRYQVETAGAQGPLTIDVALRYQPISFRWANNLREYDAPEPRRFVSFYDSMASSSSVELARTTTVVP